MNFRKYLALIAIGIVFNGATTVAEQRSSRSQQSSEEVSQYEQTIQPLLAKHCIACHGPEQQKGMVRLDTLDPTFAGPAAETWHDALNKISIGEMPPEDEAPIDTVSRRRLVSWIRAGLDRMAIERKGTGNQTVLRRLTRYEYNNTMRDLLGIKLNFAKDLPPEPSSPDGFKNNGASLGMSPLQIEYYLEAARLAMDKTIVEGRAPKVYRHHFEKSSSDKAPRGEPVAGNRMPPKGRFLARMLEYPREGDFLVRVKAGASIPEGMGFPRMRVAIGLRSDTQSPFKILGEVDVSNPETDKQVYEFRGRIEEFPLPGHNPKFPGVTITVSNVYEDGLEVPKEVKPKAVKLKATTLSAEQEQQANAAVEKNTPTLPIPKTKIKNVKLASTFVRATTKLQRQIEELRLLSNKDKNETELAYRLYDIEEGLKREAKLIEDLAKNDLHRDPQELLALYRSTNAALLADRETVLSRFQTIKPIDRKSKRTVTPKPPGPPRTTLVIDYLEFEGPLYKTWPPEHHRRLLPPLAMPERERAEQAIKSFMTRAYRRPVTDGDVAPVLSIYDEIRAKAPSFEDAMREALAMVLISPEFLYLVEPTGDSSRPLSQYELASRLSYFLWSTMPDDPLLTLAASDRLSDPAVMAGQVRRMIADPRSQNFVEHFTNQWLDLSGLDRVAINPNYYPQFDDRLKPMMKQETQAFFAEVLREDLSAMNLIDSDFAMLNEPLAKHYGIAPAPRGFDFERVNLKTDDCRGGLLTQGSFLMINSNGEDSHPIRRAVWLLDRLLDDPPPPPPPDVPEFDSELPDFASLPLKEQLELHRTKAACNDCHRNIDPWGVAFEAFDAVGLRREGALRRIGEESLTAPVDDQATLPNGTEIDGVEELKGYLLRNDRDRFSQALASKLLAYAVGRSLVLEDRPTVERLVETLKQKGYRLSDLIVAIALSEAFHSK